MVEMFKSKRVVFRAVNQQSAFLNSAINKIGLRIKDLADLLKVSPRTIFDWKRGKFLVPLEIIQLLVKMAGVQFPKNIMLREPFWHVGKAASLGGKAVLERYGQVGGDPKIRRQKWQVWWKEIGKYKSHPIINNPLQVSIPKFSPQLAEFVGIMLGDGGISSYQVTITLNLKDDYGYLKFVRKLLRQLFSVEPQVYRRPDFTAANIVISRIALVNFCVFVGIKKGK